MAKKFDEIKNDPEFAALSDIEGVDPASLVEQAGGEPVVPPVEEPVPPVVEGQDPVPPVADPVPPVVEGQDPVPPVADPASPPHDEFLKEIFGDRFKTVDEAKNANIVGTLDEVSTLRQEKADLEAKLELKPKTNFANDEVALFNEFVKETGTKDYGVFNKINNAEVATMDPMEALITKYVLDHPEQSNQEPLIRKYFEKKYNVDPDQVDESELAVNKIGMEADGTSAKKALQELKEKLKVPETPDDPSPAPELTPEQKATLVSGWNDVGNEVGTVLEKLKVPIKNGQEPLLDYEISEADKKEITTFVQSYALENHLELNDANKTMIAYMVKNQLIMNKLPEIVHSVFEKARSMTAEEVHSLYSNPSPDRNKDQPPVPPPTPQSDEEKIQQEIFDAEMKALE